MSEKLHLPSGALVTTRDVEERYHDTIKNLPIVIVKKKPRAKQPAESSRSIHPRFQDQLGGQV